MDHRALPMCFIAFFHVLRCPFKVVSRMLFDHCAQCQRCCNIDPGYPSLEVTLTANERKVHGSICIETRCELLGDQGCTLGSEKPLSCEIYPLAYDPRARTFFYDQDCPLMPEYQLQLAQPGSEARAHLSRITEAVQLHEKSDPKFLRSNFAVDSDYFDLQPLVTFSATKEGAL